MTHRETRPHPRGFARRSRLVRYLAIGYTLLIAYASLYPFGGWRDPVVPMLSFVFAPWPRYYTVADLLLNALAYVPLGFLLALSLLPATTPTGAAVATTAAGTVLSLALEVLQHFTPGRVASNLDLLTNSLGAMIGALLAVTLGERLLLSGKLYRLRQRVFLQGAGVDVGFVVLLLWLFTQFNPELWLFGNGDLRWLAHVSPNLQFSPDSYRWLETGVTACNLAAICLFTSSLAKAHQSVAAPLLALVTGALALKSAAALTLFNPGDAALWLTPGSMLGVPAGLLLYILLSPLPRSAMAVASALLLLGGAFLVNIAPDNPYVDAAVQTWQHGHFLSFNGLTRLVSTLWPAVAFGYLLWLLHARFHSRR